MNIFQKLYTLSVWSEHYRHAAEAVVEKLAKNYDKFSVAQRKHYAKLAVDNIERFKAALKEIMKLKYKPFPEEKYISIAYRLTDLEYYLLRQRYGDTRPNAVRRTKEDLAYVSYELESMRTDIINIILGKNLPLWYEKVSLSKLKEAEREVSEMYYKHFKEPLAVMVYFR